MNIPLKYPFLIIGFIFHLNTQVNAQDCVQCNGTTVTGNYASAIGNKTVASGNNSFAGGYGSQATGSNSFAFGYNSMATQSTNTAIGNNAVASGIGSIAIGANVKANAQNSFVFGAGTTTNYPLTNSTPNSIAFGINSNKPTMLITKSLNNNYTGKVAIGPVTTPQTKLHVKSDNNEDAGLFIESGNKTAQKAFIQIFDSDHFLSVDPTANMNINSGTGSLNLLGNNYCFGGKDENKTRIYTSGVATIYYNAKRSNNTETRDGEGSSYAISFDNNALQFRTAINQAPRGSEITNWKDILFLGTDGKVGIGSRNTYLKNTADQQLIIHSPQNLEVQSANITLSGKIGINTTNNVENYALAVDGGIISTKVFIKEVKQWPDYVFAEDYQLLELEELQNYLHENKHLPGVPSESEILDNGYDINTMQTIMMEKIEELTRYILLLQDEINLLKAERVLCGDSIRFSYDENGNRIARSLVFQRIPLPGQDPNSLETVSYDLFPNPTSGQFTLLLKEEVGETKLHATIFTLSGTVIEEKEIDHGQAVFDLSGKPSGVYILNIDGMDTHHSWKVIKK